MVCWSLPARPARPRSVWRIRCNRFELDADVVTRLLPLGAAQVEAMLRGLRSARLFDGFRGRAGIDVPAIAQRIAALCHWFSNQPHLQEVETNPLALRGGEAWALDALVTTTD